MHFHLHNESHATHTEDFISICHHLFADYKYARGINCVLYIKDLRAKVWRYK
jgi:hypothetical protein